MSSTDRSDHDRDHDTDRGGRSARSDSGPDGIVGWFAESTIRLALAVLGVILLLFAVGQMVGIDILGAIATALDTRIGQWLLVAIFALFLIVVALRGFYAHPE